MHQKPFYRNNHGQGMIDEAQTVYGNVIDVVRQVICFISRSSVHVYPAWCVGHCYLL